jgi:hypothetical protein
MRAKKRDCVVEKAAKKKEKVEERRSRMREKKERAWFRKLLIRKKR